MYYFQPDTVDKFMCVLLFPSVSFCSKKYGPTSKEARLAWESVEEINASDNR
jgi:hypothetical protein